MKSEQKERRALKKEFAATRVLHAALQSKAEKDRSKMERRARKLLDLELILADMERRLHISDSVTGSTVSDGGQSLRPALLIFKPPAERSDMGAAQLKDIETRLRAHGILAHSVLKVSGKQVRAVAKQAANDRVELVIVAAGDGTIEDVASQLINTETTLGIIPVGTMNNLARALGVPLLIEDACTLLGMGVNRAIDVGRVHANSADHVEYFLETAGVGLSAIVIPAGQATAKQRWALLPGVLRRLFDSQPTQLRIEVDGGKVIDVKTEVVTVSNCPMMGKNIMIAPEAKMDDGFFDIATYAGMGKTDLLGYFMQAADGKHAYDPRVVFHRAQKVRIESDRPVDAHSDKEVFERKLVLEIELIPHALRVVVGNGGGLSLPIVNAPSVPPLSGPQPETKPVEN